MDLDLLNGIDVAGGVKCVDGHGELQNSLNDALRLRQLSQNSIGITLV
jgi:hypothetical protein